MKLLLILILSLLFGMTTPAYAQQYPDIPLDKLLTQSLQAEMGLHKLTPKERDVVRVQLIQMYILGLEEGKQQRTAVSSPDVIESRVDGAFEGWRGDTLVKLMNGQIWQQTQIRISFTYRFMPGVTIYRSGRGYKMLVEGETESVGVKQLK